MGQSPREEASNKFQTMVEAMIQNRGQFGQGAARSQMGDVSPFFDRARGDLESGITDAASRLNAGLSTRMAGIQQTMGEGLINAGVPQGQGRGTAFAAALAPAIAANQQETGQLFATKALTMADLSKTEGLTMADLLKASDERIVQLLQQELGGIGGMKQSTGFGDVLGVLQTIAKIAGPAILGMINPAVGAAAAGGIGSGSTAIPTSGQYTSWQHL